MCLEGAYASARKWFLPMDCFGMRVIAQRGPQFIDIYVKFLLSGVFPEGVAFWVHGENAFFTVSCDTFFKNFLTVGRERTNV